MDEPLNLSIFPTFLGYFGKVFGNHGAIQHIAGKSVGSKGLNVADTNVLYAYVHLTLYIHR